MNGSFVLVVSVLLVFALAAYGIVVYAVPMIFVGLPSTLLVADPNLVVMDVVGNVVSSVEWGTVDKGSTSTKLFVLRNEGNVALTVTMTDTLDPSVGLLEWSLQGVSIASQSSAEFVFTLTIPTDAVSGPFSFVIEIHGEG